jgi:hypothetical protein
MPEQTPTEPQPDPKPVPPPPSEGDEGKAKGGPSSHDTSGQFPADDVGLKRPPADA